MSFISRGFQGRRREGGDSGRVPPGQYLVDDFPVLSAGPTPHTPLEEWELHDHRRGGRAEDVDVGGVPRAAERDDHERHPLRDEVVEARHGLGGVSVDTLLDEVEHDAAYVVAFCDGGYTTNLPLEDVIDGKAWVAFGYDGEPLDPEHGGPARLLVPHLYFWKSAKWVRGLEPGRPRRARASGRRRVPHVRRPVAGAAVLGRLKPLTWQLCDVAEVVEETPHVRTLVLDVPGWPGHLAGQHVDVRLTAEDGYQAQRSYSIASAPEEGRLALTVERLGDGEVSPYLTDVLVVGDRLELRGPIGGYFVWEPARAGPSSSSPAGRASCRSWR